MAAPEVWDIKIHVRRTDVWIHASEDAWVKREVVEPEVKWRYGFEYSKGERRRLLRPIKGKTYDEPVLLLTKLDNELKILLEEFRGAFKVDIYAFDKLVWKEAGGATRRYVGDTKVVPIPAVPPRPPPPPPRPPECVCLTDETIKALAEEIASRQLQLPNRVDSAKIDTSKTSFLSLKDGGELKADVMLGFYIESVGGGFTYKVQRGDYQSQDKAAVDEDRWDIEFDDLIVAGSGTSGTAVIWYWWRST